MPDDNLAHLSANDRYEQKKKNAGYKKITIWVPTESEDHFKEIANFCCENTDCYPAHVKSFKTGRIVRM